MNILDTAAESLRAAGVERPRAEARLLLAHAMDVSQEVIIAESATPDAAQLTRFNALLARRAAREPFAYIVGSREFWSLDFAVGPGVLIPRPETELLVEEALKRFPDPDAPLKVLDLGTGSGCVLLAFLSMRKNAKGIGVDLSAEALVYARRSAASLGLAARAEFLAGDWTDAPQTEFDVIFVNPPYIERGEIAYLEPDVTNHEPHLALDGGLDGCDAHRRVAPELAPRLKPNGVAFVEIGHGQVEDIGKIYLQNSLGIEEIAPDLASIARCLVVKPAQAGCLNNPKKNVEMDARSG